MVKHLLSTGKEVYLDGYLKNALDSLVYNINNDWDFVIIITGDGMVRTGKSVLGLTVSSYLADKLKTEFSVKNNIFFEGQNMIDAAQKAPPNSVFQYDEAREALASSKRFNKLQQDLIDFFNECGQLNHIFVLVLPDYFSLNWELATNRSELLLNVYRKEQLTERNGSPITIFKRGQFELFNRRAKAKLYWKNKRAGLKSYQMVKPSIPPGSFTNNYPINEEEYRAKKKDMLKRFTERHNKEKEERINVWKKHFIRLAKILKGDGLNISQYSRSLGFSSDYLGQIARKEETEPNTPQNNILHSIKKPIIIQNDGSGEYIT